MAELIVLVDEAGREIGTMPKPLVHHGETPLHRAFSAYLFDDAGRLLVTRRAENKQTFPGMWTNTVCGHPARGRTTPPPSPAAPPTNSASSVADLRPALPGYRYRAEFLGVVENEICPVYLGRFTGTPAPAAAEVGEWELLGVGGLPPSPGTRGRRLVTVVSRAGGPDRGRRAGAGRLSAVSRQP